MATPRQLIDVVYSIIADNNISRILPVLDEQIVLYIPEHMPVGGEYHGRSGFLTLMSGVYKRWENLRLPSLVYLIPDDPSASDVIVTTGVMEGTLLLDNEPAVLPFIHYWQVKDDKIKVLRAFNWDTASLRQRVENKSAGSPNGQPKSGDSNGQRYRGES